MHLTLLLDQGPDAPGVHFQSSNESFHDLHEVLARVADDPAVVVLGPPGAGKSTLLRHYELDTARTVLTAGGDLSQAPLTFFVPLNDYKPPRTGVPLLQPGAWLAARWAVRQPALPPLETLLRERRLTLLLDALNEMSADLIPLWRDWLHTLAQETPGTRVLFSCRSLDYSVTLSSKTLPVPQVRIEALSDAQVEAFVQRYCPEAIAAALWQQLRGTPQLELLRSPYYLKLLVQQSSDGHIPRGRAALFTGFVWQALRREVEGDHPLFLPDMLEARNRQRLLQYGQPPPPVLPERGLLLPRLSTLAWQMQQRGAVQESTQVRLAYDEAVALLDHPRAVDILHAGEALGVVDEDQPQDAVLFVHQLLQEYFAARRLALASQPALVQQPWRATEVVPDLQTTLATLADSDPLPPLPGTGWEETTVLAAAMARQSDAFIAALMEANLPLAGRCAAQPKVQVSEALRGRLRQALVARTQDPTADLRARTAAGLALGPLGDPRFERRQGRYGAYLLPPMIAIPGGTYRIGSDEGHYAPEAPVHAVELAPFALGQFPVTNAEWALFMQAGGYDEERWWEGTEAQAWRCGESTAEGAKQQWHENRKTVREHLEEIRQWPQQGRMTSKRLESWESWVSMSDEAFTTQLDTWYPPGRQTQPAYWNDDAFNKPAQPVVGLCWFEARAYCAWLSAQTGVTFRLPTEAEWEAAARGREGRRYAFGDDFEASCCNVFEAHVRRTTPIGVFPGGAPPEGLVDMIGNTWDWTSSLFADYPYDAVDGREEVHPTSSARRVVRGGSWDDDFLDARAAYRTGSAPGNRDNSLGLRLVRVVPSSRSLSI